MPTIFGQLDFDGLSDVFPQLLNSEAVVGREQGVAMALQEVQAFFL
jgi:hypothetical protein